MEKRTSWDARYPPDKRNWEWEDQDPRSDEEREIGDGHWPRGGSDELRNIAVAEELGCLS